MPTLAVTAMVRSPATIARPAISRRRDSATCCAPITGVSGRMIRNSSPPYRHRTSELRSTRVSLAPTARSRSSPRRCPSSSLMVLKWSMSNIRIDSGCRDRRARRSSPSSVSRPWPRLKQPVRPSRRLCSRVSSSSSTFRTAIAMSPAAAPSALRWWAVSVAASWMPTTPSGTLAATIGKHRTSPSRIPVRRASGRVAGNSARSAIASCVSTDRA